MSKNMTAYLAINTQKWQEGLVKAENQTKQAFTAIEKEAKKLNSQIGFLTKNSQTKGDLIDKLEKLGATSAQINTIVSKFEYAEKLKQARSEAIALQQAEAQRIATLQTIKQTIISTLAVFGTSQIVKLADDFGQLSAQLKNMLGNEESLSYVIERIKENIKTTYRPLEEAVQGFQGVYGSLNALGYSLKDIADFNDAITFSFTASGTSADKASSAINALTKSFSAGRVDAKSWQSILIAIPDTAKIIAENLGKTESEIRQLGVSGKISVNELVNSFTAIRADKFEQASNMTASLKDGFTYLRNSIQLFVGTANQAGGYTAKLADVLKFLGDNIETISKLILAIAAVKVIGYINGITGAITAQIAVHAKNIASITAENAVLAQNTTLQILNSRARAGNATAGVAIGTAGAIAGGIGGIAGVAKGVASSLGTAGVAGAIAGILVLTGQWENSTDTIKYIYQDIANFIATSKNFTEELIYGFDVIKNLNLADSLDLNFDDGIFGVLETFGYVIDTIVGGIKAVGGTVADFTLNSFHNVGLAIFKTLASAVEAIENAVNGSAKAINKVLPEKLEIKTDFQIGSESFQKELETIKNAQFISTTALDNAIEKINEQREFGLESYFREMTSEIRTKRELAKQEQDALKESIRGIDGINSALQQQKENLENATQKTPTQQQFEIEKLYQQGEYDKAWQLQSQQRYLLSDVDWNLLNQMMNLPTFSNLGDLSENTALIDNSNNLSENTSALIELNNTINTRYATDATVRTDNSGGEAIGSINLIIADDNEKLSGRVTGTRNFINALMQFAQNQALANGY